MKNDSIIFEREKQKISLFGRELFLSETMTSDFMQLSQFVIDENQNSDTTFIIMQNAQALHNGLKCNLEVIPKWRIFKRRAMKKLISLKNLTNNLSQKQLAKYSREVLILDGLINPDDEENKKKVEAENQATLDPSKVT